MGGFLGGLTVEPVRNSRLVKLHYDSPDPQRAAAILNALVKNYINMSMERRFDASTYARNFLQERLQQVKAKLEDSERELVKFARQEQIISVDDKQNTVSQNLRATNAALAEAEKKRIAAEAAYRQVMSTRGQGLSQILDSSIIQTLKETKAKLETQYQENLNIYKPAYPTMVQLRGQIGQVDAMINQEINNIRAAATASYEAARAEEALLRGRMEQLKQDVLSLQDRSIQLNILRREVDTNRQLYDGLLQRFKEVGVAAGIGTNNISVVDEAKTPAWALQAQPAAERAAGAGAGPAGRRRPGLPVRAPRRHFPPARGTGEIAGPAGAGGDSQDPPGAWRGSAHGAGRPR